MSKNGCIREYCNTWVYKMIDTSKMCDLDIRWKLIVFNFACLGTMVFVLWGLPKMGLGMSVIITVSLFVVNGISYKTELKECAKRIALRVT